MKLLYSVCYYLFFLLLFGLDIKGIFFFSDIPFFLACIGSFLFAYMFGNSCTRNAALFIIIVTALSYLRSGSSVRTERLSEWFVLYLVLSIVLTVFDRRKKA